jgi:hypothetical protein
MNEMVSKGNSKKNAASIQGLPSAAIRAMSMQDGWGESAIIETCRREGTILCLL